MLAQEAPQGFVESYYESCRSSRAGAWRFVEQAMIQSLADVNRILLAQFSEFWERIGRVRLESTKLNLRKKRFCQRKQSLPRLRGFTRGWTRRLPRP